jgi:hypothetical protein
VQHHAAQDQVQLGRRRRLRVQRVPGCASGASRSAEPITPPTECRHFDDWRRAFAIRFRQFPSSAGMPAAKTIIVALLFPPSFLRSLDFARIQTLSSRREAAEPSTMVAMKPYVLALTLLAFCAPAVAAQDTVFIEVGSPAVDGRIFAPHAARVRIYRGDTLVSQWLNELTLADSAGRRIMRWVTTGEAVPASPQRALGVLRQTYDARTLAPLGYSSTVMTTGTFQHLTIDGNRVRGSRRLASDTGVTPVAYPLERPGFFAGASDLVPVAAGLRTGSVMVAPVWSPGMQRAQDRVFHVLGDTSLLIEGSPVRATKVEERRRQDRSLYATWYLMAKSPYMVYGEVPLPDGRVQRMTEEEVPLRDAAPAGRAGVPDARRSDVESPDAIIAALYDVISGPAGQARDWNRMRSLFAPGARLLPTTSTDTGTVLHSLDTDAYIASTGDWLVRNGFFEREINRRSERFGPILHAFSVYEARRKPDDPQPFLRGVNSIQLMFDGRRWWVVNILWANETGKTPIPASLLGRQH